jgi:integrase
LPPGSNTEVEDGRWRPRCRDVRGSEHARQFTRRIEVQNWLDSVAARSRREPAIPRSLIDELSVALVGRDRGDLQFTSPKGGVLRNRNARGLWFDKAAAAIGEPGLAPHELRHTAASLAISAGANVKAVQRMLGHASAAMTLDRYADLFDDDLDAASDRLDAVRDSARGLSADSLRADGLLIKPSRSPKSSAAQQNRGLQSVETRGIEPLTPALQRRCSAN